MDVLILVVDYFIEVIRFSIGLEIFFGKKMKITGFVAVIGALYALCLIWAGEIGPILLYIFACAAVYHITEGRAGEKIFQILVVLCVSGILDELIGLAIQHYVADYRYIRFLEAVIVLILFIFAREVQRRKPKFIMCIAGFIKEKIMIIILILFILLSAIIVGFCYADDYSLSSNFKYYIGFFAFIGMIMLLLFIIYIKKSNETISILMETERSLKIMQEKYYKELLEREEDTRRYRHDMQNHLLCLVQYMERQETEVGIRYIKGLQNNLVSIQERCYMTGNSLLDLFLNHYLLPLKNVKINIWGACADDILIDDIDFCIIFSNLLQNAAEAVERQKENEKYIRVILKQRSEYCEIDIQNSIAAKLKAVGGTDKTDKRNHGIGLKNVSEVVKRNSGYFEFGIKNDEFLATVILKRGKKE